MSATSLEPIVNLCKRRGFVVGSSEIYGGVASIFDFGPYGILLKNNLKQLWWETFIQKRDDVVGIESSIIMHPRVWEASGHLENFSDPMVECSKCHFRFREDHLIEIQKSNLKNQNDKDENQKLSDEAKKVLKCPQGGEHEWLPAKQFNLMFKTFLGSTQETASEAYLRPETAQGMFTNFKYVLETSRKKVPFGIAQVGKSFRNEIGLGNFMFRLREFEIAELEFFVKPGTDDEWFDKWVSDWEAFLLNVGLAKDNLFHDVKKKESLAHYSKATTDLQYKYPWGFDEIAGIANRTDFDLKRHSEFSGKDMNYFDQESGEKFVPFVIEPTLGIERLFVAILCEAYQEIAGGRGEQAGEDKEFVLNFNYNIAPIKAAVFPLVKKDRLPEIAHTIADKLKDKWAVEYDESGSIGRRYRRQDEIGTPFGITIDFQTLEDETVTIRDRRTMEQQRVKIEDLETIIDNSLKKNLLSIL